MNSFGQMTDQQPAWGTYLDSNIGLGKPTERPPQFCQLTSLLILFQDDQLGTFNDSEEELPSDKPINLKPRVTYDTLRNKNRAEYYNYQGYNLLINYLELTSLCVNFLLQCTGSYCLLVYDTF